MLAVSPAAQGRGIGTALLQRVLDDKPRAGSAPRSSARRSRPCGPPTRSTSGWGSCVLPERDWSPVPGVDLLAFGAKL
jgi:GNAT superfamily N-acetyltransferase